MPHKVRSTHSSRFCVSTVVPKHPGGTLGSSGGRFINTDKEAKTSLGSGALVASSEEKPEEGEPRSGCLWSSQREFFRDLGVRKGAEENVCLCHLVPQRQSEKLRQRASWGPCCLRAAKSLCRNVHTSRPGEATAALPLSSVPGPSSPPRLPTPCAAARARRSGPAAPLGPVRTGPAARAPLTREAAALAVAPAPLQHEEGVGALRHP